MYETDPVQRVIFWGAIVGALLAIAVLGGAL